MGSVTIIQNQTVVIDLPTDFSDNGWSISNGTATHSGCNNGKILLNLNIPVGTYKITYEVSNRASGSVYAYSGSFVGVPRSANGIYTEEVEINGSLGFYATGDLSLKTLAVAPNNQPDTSLTLAFNENVNKWVTYYSYVPEMMCKFINGFYCFKNGQLWEQNVNALRNNFFGQQYSSKIIFYVNINPSTIKQYWTIRLKSNKAWSVTEATIRPIEGKSEGMRSRIKKGNFKPLQGDWFADFLRNMDDPRFTSELDALMRGNQLHGNVLKITIENDNSVEVRLLQVDVSYSFKNYTY